MRLWVGGSNKRKVSAMQLVEIHPMFKKFPMYDSHEGAATAGCFFCGSPLDREPVDTGYPPPIGRFSQLCTGRCNMRTYYDIRGDETKLKKDR